MKKLLAILIIVGMLLGLFIFAIPTKRPPVTDTQTQNEPTDTSDIAFDFEEEVAPEDIRILSESSGDLNGDGKSDRGVVLSVTGGGTGVFIYAAASVSGPVGYKSSNAVYIGDRVKPEEVSIKDGVFTVKYLTRREDESFSDEPTVAESKEFVYVNGELKEK